MRLIENTFDQKRIYANLSASGVTKGLVLGGGGGGGGSGGGGPQFFPQVL